MHRLPFSAEELLLMAGLSRSFLVDSEFRRTFHADNPALSIRTDSIVERLSEFLRTGVERNKLIRGNTAVTRLVEALLAPDSAGETDDVPDEQLQLQP